jgi:pimeloyl-ACP methyl ester carboxylesterase
MRHNQRLEIDTTVALDVNGSTQRLRVCGTRATLPPLLVVQAGPGLPLLHEVPKFQRLLNLERDFVVAYWEQRGCGNAPRNDAMSVSWAQQIDDLRSILAWFHGETKQRVAVLGISMGGTMALRAAEHERDRVKALILVSPDSSTTESDAAADAFLRHRASTAGNRGLARRVAKLPRPPYLRPAPLQQRARLLADLGTIENGKTFGALLREMLAGLIRAYGIIGAARSLRNVNLVQSRILPQIVSLDLFADRPHVTVPVHYLFGGRDALYTSSVPDRLAAAIGAPGGTVVRVPEAGHMVHFDRPDIVRSVLGSIGRSTPSRQVRSGSRPHKSKAGGGGSDAVSAFSPTRTGPIGCRPMRGPSSIPRDRSSWIPDRGCICWTWSAPSIRTTDGRRHSASNLKKKSVHSFGRLASDRGTCARSCSPTCTSITTAASRTSLTARFGSRAENFARHAGGPDARADICRNDGRPGSTPFRSTVPAAPSARSRPIICPSSSWTNPSHTFWPATRRTTSD